MFTRPDDLSDADVVGALSAGWGVSVVRADYAAVGFGSHHWRASGEGARWFVSVDDLAAKRRDDSETNDDAAARIGAALGVARALWDSGLKFVVAPQFTQSRELLHRLDDRYAVALYAHVDGATHDFEAYPDRSSRLAVLDRIAAIHASSLELGNVDDHAIPRRGELERVIADPGLAWGPGPYANDARDLLQKHKDELAQVLARYDALVAEVARRPERRVITHGEPHRGNTIGTEDGVVLIDWDTALLAPPERDLWSLISEDAEIANDYTQRTGIDVDGRTTETYRLWWGLCEIALYAHELFAPHRESEDIRAAWVGLRKHLDPMRWL